MNEVEGHTTQHPPLRQHEAHSYLHMPHHWRSGRVVRYRNFNPTHMEMHDPHTGATIEWGARSHRKHRYPFVRRHDGRPLKRPRYRIWGWDFDNISWWVAQLFVWGSVAWVLNGQLLFTPHGSENFTLYFTGYTALAGGTLFWFGAYLAIVEALNTDQQVNFTHELLDVMHHDAEAVAGFGSHVQPHHRSRLPPSAQNNGGAPAVLPDSPANGSNGRAVPNNNSAVEMQAPATSQPPRQKFRWFGWRGHDIGFLAVFVQFIGATLFEISVIAGLPHVLPAESSTNWWTWDALFWGQQVVGAWGFIISSVVFMLEVQHKWWRPAPLRLGWQVGFWNLIGAIGFEASAIGGVLAFPANVPQKWPTSFSTYWGAWAFLIGSYLQLLECLNKHPTSVGQRSSVDPDAK